MAYEDLRDWIAALEHVGELRRITTEVDPILEITEIADRVSKMPASPQFTWGRVSDPARASEARQFADAPSFVPAANSGNAGGPALLFQNIKGHPGHQVLPMLAEMGQFFPKTVSTGPCKEVIRKDNFSLDWFPILHCWPKDAGRFITLPCVVTRDTKTGKRNVGCYRLQVYDERTTALHWQRQKIGAEHYREALRRAAAQSEAEHYREALRRAAAQSDVGAGVPARASVDIMARSSGGAVLAEGQRPAGKMEVAVAIGTDPAVTFSSIVPAPPDVEEYLIAGFLRQKPVELVKCETVDLEVPATSEIVLEGHVHLDELRTEGPFGDHTGFYSLEDLYPVFHLSCITHRKNPVYATTIVGKPPMEDAWMGKAVERIFLPLMKLSIPELVDINLPVEGIFHNLMIASIKKSYPGQARKVMNAIWSLGQAMFTKCIIVVDEDVNVQDIGDVTLKVLNHIDPERDIQFTLGPIDSLDHASRLPNYGSKMGVDATRKWASEGFTRPWPDEILMDAKTKALVDSKWKKLAKELGLE